MIGLVRRAAVEPRAGIAAARLDDEASIDAELFQLLGTDGAMFRAADDDRRLVDRKLDVIESLQPPDRHLQQRSRPQHLDELFWEMLA